MDDVTSSNRQTPLQQAIQLVLGAYQASARRLTAPERDVLRDVIAARLAHDYLTEQGVFDNLDQEQAA